MKKKRKWGEIPLLVMDKIMAWYVRGLNNKDKQRLIKNLIDLTHISLVSLLKTRIKRAKLGEVNLNMFKGWAFTTNFAWHKGGRIILAWIPSKVTVYILQCNG